MTVWRALTKFCVFRVHDYMYKGKAEVLHISACVKKIVRAAFCLYSFNLLWNEKEVLECVQVLICTRHIT